MGTMSGANIRWRTVTWSSCMDDTGAMSMLSAERCVACRRDSPRVSEAEIAELEREVSGWQLLERDGVARLERVFHFPSFADALTFTNRVGALAEAEGHHPALLTEWGRTTVTWWTHKIRGLHRNDFIMAAKTDVLAIGSAHITPEETRARGAP
jgi:4a-hydroxytetrahydrobiopterin dehydratase